MNPRSDGFNSLEGGALRRLPERLAADEVDLLVGTHVLIQEGVRFKACVFVGRHSLTALDPPGETAN